MDTQRRPIIIPAKPPGETPALPPGTTHWGTDLEKLKRSEQDMLAATSRTPGVVADALSPTTPTFAGRELHEFTVQTYLNLQKIGSPFAERKVAPAAEPEVPAMSDIIRALWVMTTDDEVARRIIARGGEFLEDEIAAFASKIKMTDLTGSEVINEQIGAAFAPAAKMNPPEQQGGDSPLEAASSAMEPAGS